MLIARLALGPALLGQRLLAERHLSRIVVALLLALALILGLAALLGPMGLELAFEVIAGQLGGGLVADDQRLKAACADGRGPQLEASSTASRPNHRRFAAFTSSAALRRVATVIG